MLPEITDGGKGVVQFDFPVLQLSDESRNSDSAPVLLCFI